jgi:hypothetical protein
MYRYVNFYFFSHLVSEHTVVAANQMFQHFADSNIVNFDLILASWLHFN